MNSFWNIKIRSIIKDNYPIYRKDAKGAAVYLIDKRRGNEIC